MLGRRAAAGDASYDGIAAASDDGSTVAAFALTSGVLKPDGCGMRKAGDAAIIVHARCAAADPMDLLPFEKWQWVNPTPEVRRLKVIARPAPPNRARVGTDSITGLSFVEVRDGDAWLRGRLVDEPMAEVSGVLDAPGRIVVRLHFEDDNLLSWEEVWAPTLAEVRDEAGRYEAARKEAEDATTRMREHREKGEAVFAPAPPGTRREVWERRQRHGMATFLRKWEIASIYRPLSTADLSEAMWLLAWLESPGEGAAREALQVAHVAGTRPEPTRAVLIDAPRSRSRRTRARARLSRGSEEARRGTRDVHPWAGCERLSYAKLAW